MPVEASSGDVDLIPVLTQNAAVNDIEYPEMINITVHGISDSSEAEWYSTTAIQYDPKKIQKDSSLSAPRNVVPSLSVSSLNVRWDRVTGAAGYIYKITDENGGNVVLSGTVSSNSLSKNGDIAGDLNNDCRIYVCSTDGNGKYGEWSEPVTLSGESVEDIKKGDLNEDGNVDDKDAAIIARYIMNRNSGYIAAYDINGDKVIDVRDIMALRRTA